MRPQPHHITPIDKSIAVLKKPLHTNIAVEMDEFVNVEVEDKLHIIISVKDFRAILQHAQIISGDLTTCYSSPGRPMKLSYNSDGVFCEFILMTVGEEDAIGQKHKNPRANSAAARATRPELDSGARRGSSVVNENKNRNSQAAQVQTSLRNPAPQHKTPIRPRQPQFEIRPQPNQQPNPPPPASARSTRSDSLFVGQADDDQQWEPLNPEEEEDEGQNDRLEWNSNNEPVFCLSLRPCKQHTNTLDQNPSTLRISSYANPPAQPEPPAPDPIMAGLEPTQRLSQVCFVQPEYFRPANVYQVRRFGLFSS